jgi:RNA polymerase sigma-70 factor (ECF subfamily)
MEQSEFEREARMWRDLAYETGLANGADPDEAEDVAQDTLLKLWALHDELERYRSVVGLTRVIARNLTIDLHRNRRTVRLDKALGNLPVFDRFADSDLISREEEKLLNQWLAQLPPRQHQVLVMRQVEHRSYEEIAALLGIGVSSAKVLLSRARKWMLNECTKHNS